MRLPTSRVGVQRAGKHFPAYSYVVESYLQISAFSCWAMLDLNQRPPPCKSGQTFQGEFCPVGKSRIYKRFLPFLAPSFSCSVRMRPAPVAARLQHLTFLGPAPFPHTLSGPGNPLVIESCAERCAEQASPTPVQNPEPLKDPVPFLCPLISRFLSAIARHV